MPSGINHIGVNMLQEQHVVTCFLESDNEILILRRSNKVGSYQGKWAGVSGYIDNTADEQAITEIREETDLSEEDIELTRRGETLTVKDERLSVMWTVYPYLFRIKDRSKIKLDWEHTDIRWIKPRELKNFNTVPKLKETLAQVLQSGRMR